MLRLRELREAKGISQQELSRLSGVKTSTIGMLELGRRACPRLDTAQRLALALGCKVDDLLPDSFGAAEKEG